MFKLSVVIPVYNEEANIELLYSRLKQSLKQDFQSFEYEIIFVDDGSFDQTFEKLVMLRQQDMRVKIIQFSRNFGHHLALTAGLDQASGDLIVMMDGDLQDQPEQIIKLYNKLQEGYDVVYAKRKKSQFGLIKRFFSKAFSLVIRLMVKEKITISGTIFQIMTKQVLDSIRQLREQNRYLVGIIGWVGFKHAEQEVDHGQRQAGQSKYSLGKQFDLALDAIFAFSEYPLKFIIRFGLLLVVGSLVYIFYIFYKKLVLGTPELGWSSLIVSLFSLFGIQFIILGVLGEYIGRIYRESKNRPLYIIKKKLF